MEAHRAMSESLQLTSAVRLAVAPSNGKGNGSRGGGGNGSAKDDDASPGGGSGGGGGKSGRARSVLRVAGDVLPSHMGQLVDLVNDAGGAGGGAVSAAGGAGGAGGAVASPENVEGGAVEVGGTSGGGSAAAAAAAAADGAGAGAGAGAGVGELSEDDLFYPSQSSGPLRNAGLDFKNKHASKLPADVMSTSMVGLNQRRMAQKWSTIDWKKMNESSRSCRELATSVEEGLLQEAKEGREKEDAERPDDPGG